VPRLVAFGCSNTFGHGLVDCWNDKLKQPGNAPSKYAWPSVLGSNLGLDVVNLSRCGGSNREIWWNIVNTKFQSADTVVILWSYNYRYCILNDPYVTDQPEQLGIWDNTPASSLYKKTSVYRPDLDFAVESLTFMDHANRYLKSLRIKNIYHYAPNAEEWKSTSPEEHKWCDVRIVDYANDIWFGINEFALDNAHPGPKMQKAFAEKVQQHIKETKNEH
jgi:hypothetical protein